MSVWRIDRVHATTEDGMWLQTVVRTDGGDVFDEPGTWHRPVDPKALAAALQDARLPTRSAGENPSIASSAESAPSRCDRRCRGRLASRRLAGGRGDRRAAHRSGRSRCCCGAYVLAGRERYVLTD